MATTIDPGTDVAIGTISGDSHVNEPRTLWLDNLPASLRDQAMHGIEAGDDGNWELILEGHHIDRSGAEEQERLTMLDPAHRLRGDARGGHRR